MFPRPEAKKAPVFTVIGLETGLFFPNWEALRQFIVPHASYIFHRKTSFWRLRRAMLSQSIGIVISSSWRMWKACSSRFLFLLTTQHLVRKLYFGDDASR